MMPSYTRFVLRFLPFGIIALFFWHKYPFFSLPYFLDEMGVYIQSVYHMASHQIRLAPDAVPPEFSRGHPLLFSWIYAWPFRFFGYTKESVHALSWGITAILALSIYFHTLKLSSAGSALIALVVFLIQPVVLAQSTLVLPEMFHALLFFLAYLALFYNRYLLYFFITSGALLVKESGLILVASAFAWRVVHLRGTYKEMIRQGCVILSPLIVFFAWFIWQKKLLGWYFFPLHLDLMKWSFSNALSQMQQGFDFLFLSQGRRLITQASLILLAVSLLQGYRSRLAQHLFPFFWLLAATLAFVSVNFFMHRYFLLLFPLWSVFVGLSFYPLRKHLLIIISVLVMFLWNVFPHINSGKFTYDIDYSFRDNLMLQQKAYHVITDNVKTGDTLYTSFLLWSAFHYDINGFKDFHHIPVTMVWDDAFTYAAYVTADEQKAVLKDYSQLELLWRDSCNQLKAEFYRRK